MSKRRRVVPPRILIPRTPWPRVFLTILVLAAIVGAFTGGVYLGRQEVGSLMEQAQTLGEECDRHAKQTADLEQEVIVLERTLQIDREANRSARESLKSAQDKRHALEKELSFLRRLIREGGGGILTVQDFQWGGGDNPEEIGYSFTVAQLIQDFGESVGTVIVSVVGKKDGKEVTLPLNKLPGSKPTSHKLRFKHFQNIEGWIKLPEDLEPENLVVEIKPTTKKLIPVMETFAWNSDDRESLVTE